MIVTINRFLNQNQNGFTTAEISIISKKQNKSNEEKNVWYYVNIIPQDEGFELIYQ